MYPPLHSLLVWSSFVDEVGNIILWQDKPDFDSQTWRTSRQCCCTHGMRHGNSYFRLCCFVFTFARANLRVNPNFSPKWLARVWYPVLRTQCLHGPPVSPSASQRQHLSASCWLTSLDVSKSVFPCAARNASRITWWVPFLCCRFQKQALGAARRGLI